MESDESNIHFLSGRLSFLYAYLEVPNKGLFMINYCGGILSGSYSFYLVPVVLSPKRVVSEKSKNLGELLRKVAIEEGLASFLEMPVTLAIS